MNETSSGRASDFWEAMAVSGAIQTRSLAGGQALFRQGQVVSHLYRLESGRVRLVRQTENGTAVLVHCKRSAEALVAARA